MVDFASISEQDGEPLTGGGRTALMKNLTRTVITTALVVFGLQMQGCAFGDRDVDLAYSPTSTITSNSAQKVAVMTFVDDRPNQEAVGEIRNNLMIKTANVTSSNEVSTWISDALIAELEQTGANVRGSDSGLNSEIALTINGSVQESFIKQMGWLMTTTVRAQVSLNKDGVTYSDTEYVGKSTGVLVAPSVSQYRNLLESALQDMMDTLVPDILDAMD
jgi:hypothetical protein